LQRIINYRNINNSKFYQAASRQPITTPIKVGDLLPSGMLLLLYKRFLETQGLI
jgi:hypothetical protein